MDDFDTFYGFVLSYLEFDSRSSHSLQDLKQQDSINSYIIFG